MCTIVKTYYEPIEEGIGYKLVIKDEKGNYIGQFSNKIIKIGKANFYLHDEIQRCSFNEQHCGKFSFYKEQVMYQRYALQREWALIKCHVKNITHETSWSYNDSNGIYKEACFLAEEIVSIEEV